MSIIRGNVRVLSLAKWRNGENMEASGHGLPVDEFVLYQRTSIVLLMSLKEMVSSGKPKLSPKRQNSSTNR